MIIQGVLDILQGSAAAARDHIYIAVHHYTFEFNLTSWGWIHIILGALLVLTGACLLRGALWARAVGIALAGLAVIANFMWLPYTPLWAMIGVALGLFVIWSLCRTALGHHH